MPRENLENLVIENARIIFKNFEGRKDTYNKNGVKTFSVVIDDPDVAHKLMEDGWNVKMRKPRDEDEEPRYHLPVTVSFGNYPPRIFMVTGRAKVQLDDITVANLDHSEITSADMVIRPYSWEVNGDTGIKAYLKTMYVTIEQDEFADKYEFEGDAD